MDRDEAEKLINAYAIAIEHYNSPEYNSEDAETEMNQAWHELLSALTAQGQERPDGPGEYYVTIKLNLEKCVAQCANEHCPRLWSPDITIPGCDDSDGICIGDIEGTWRKVG